MGASVMAGKLDEISFTLGQLRAELSNVAQSIETNRKLADCRHTDNQNRLSTIERTLSPLHETVTKIVPIVDSIQIARWKVIGAFSVLSLVLAGIWWGFTLIAGKLLTWGLSLIR